VVTTEVHCDKCGGLIEADRTELVVNCGPLRSKRGSFDYCLPCVRALEAWTTTPPEPGR